MGALMQLRALHTNDVIRCRQYWWTNLLFINNFHPTAFHDTCMSWTWSVIICTLVHPPTRNVLEDTGGAGGDWGGEGHRSQCASSRKWHSVTVRV